MKIAVTYENGQVFQHFGHTEQFKIYDVSEGTVTSAQVIPTNGSGHGALAGFLAQNGVDVLICGGIGGGAQAALAEAGIQLYGGVSGSADDAVKSLLAGTLHYDPHVITMTMMAKHMPAADMAARHTPAADTVMEPTAAMEKHDTKSSVERAMEYLTQLPYWDTLSAVEQELVRHNAAI